VAWSLQQQQGFALAAAAHSDAGASLALAGLVADAAERAAAEARRVSQLGREARRAWVRELLAPSAAPIELDESSAPPRALALLATAVDKARGRRWLERAPLPRAGYAPDPRLVSLLRRLAARGGG
jgi:hypothetical protein